MKHYRLARRAACAASALTPLWAHAQGPKPNAIEDVVVTAQRRTENVEKVPLAITAISSKSLKAAGVRSGADLGNLVPGLTVSSFGSNTNVATRAAPSNVERYGGVDTLTGLRGEPRNPLATQFGYDDHARSVFGAQVWVVHRCGGQGPFTAKRSRTIGSGQDRRRPRIVSDEKVGEPMLFDGPDRATRFRLSIDPARPSR